MASIDINGIIEDPFFFKYAEDQTPEMCMAAVEKNPSAIKFVNPELLHLLES